MRISTLVACLVVFSMLTACSTRQVVDKLSGSTAQRLVTLSINKLIKELPKSPLDQLQGHSIWLDAHFIKDDPIVDYATARLKAEINQRHQVSWAESVADADRVIKVFYTSLGTDQDSFGFSLPIPTVTTESNEIGRIDLLAYNMYHGISEMYFYVEDVATQKVVESERLKAQIRTDKLSLPIITIPVSTLD